jgi:hypothetical protein
MPDDRTADDVDAGVLERRVSVLANALFVTAAIVLAVSLIAAIVLASSDETIVGFENVERQGRSVAAFGALGGGLTAAGILAGLGGVLKLLLERGRR